MRSVRGNLSPELWFVIGCVRQVLGLPTLRGAEGEPDWSLVATLAAREGLGPLIHRGLEIGDTLPSGPFPGRMRAAYLSSVVRTRVWLEPTIREVLGKLQGLGLDPIVLKGAALAYTAYPEPAHRTMSDIDLLLPADQLDIARATLLAIGFSDDDSGKPPSHHLVRLHRQSAPPPGEIGVELHHQLLPEPSPYQLDLSPFQHRSRVVGIAGVPARIHAPTDALLFACVHLAFTHRYGRLPLRSLTDILAITTTFGHDLDWSLLVDTVRCSRTAGAVFWPLWLSHTWLGAPIPDGVLTRLGVPGAMRRLVEVVAQPRYVLGNEEPSDPGSEVLYRLILDLSLYGGCSTREQIGSVRRSLFPSPEAVSHLPRSVTDAPLPYAFQLFHPRRVARGLGASRRVLWQALIKEEG